MRLSLRSLAVAGALVGALGGCDLIASPDGEILTLEARTGTPSLDANGVLVDVYVRADDPRALGVFVSAGDVVLLGLPLPAATMLCVDPVKAGAHRYTAQLHFPDDEVVLAATLFDDGSDCTGEVVESSSVAIPRHPQPQPSSVDAAPETTPDAALTVDGGTDATVF